jgi:hypothetical protein
MKALTLRWTFFSIDRFGSAEKPDGGDEEEEDVEEKCPPDVR